MTLRELEEKIPYMLSITYAQDKAIIIYEDESCQHIRMNERICRTLEDKLLENMKLRVKNRVDSPKVKKETKPKGRPKRLYARKYDSEKVVEMYMSGESYKTIAKEIGFSTGAIGEIIAKLKMSGRITSRTKLGKYDQLIIDSVGFKSMAQLARELEVVVETLYRRKHVLVKRGLIK